MPSFTNTPQLAIRVRRSVVPPMTYLLVDTSIQNYEPSEMSSEDHKTVFYNKSREIVLPRSNAKRPLKLHFRPKVLVLTNTTEQPSIRNRHFFRYSLKNKVVCYVRDDASFELFLNTNLGKDTSQSVLVFLHYKVRNERDELGLMLAIDQIHRQVTSLYHPEHVRVEAFIRTNSATYTKIQNHFKESGTVALVENKLESL